MNLYYKSTFLKDFKNIESLEIFKEKYIKKQNEKYLCLLNEYKMLDEKRKYILENKNEEDIYFFAEKLKTLCEKVPLVVTEIECSNLSSNNIKMVNDKNVFTFKTLGNIIENIKVEDFNFKILEN